MVSEADDRCMGVAKPSFNLRYGSGVASAAQANANLQRASDGIWVIRAGPLHTEHYCCMEGQYYHCVQL
jgi:hypothetical protein